MVDVSHLDKTLIKKWADGNLNSPHKKIWEKVFNHDWFKAINKQHNIKEKIIEISGHLNDVIHNKIKIGKFNPLFNFFELYLSRFFEVCESIAILLATNKPLVLIDLPIDDKFGGNPPVFLDYLFPA